MVVFANAPNKNLASFPPHVPHEYAEILSQERVPILLSVLFSSSMAKVKGMSTSLVALLSIALMTK